MIEVRLYDETGRHVKSRWVKKLKEARLIGFVLAKGSSSGSVCYRKEGKLKAGSPRVFWWNPTEGKWTPQRPAPDEPSNLFGD